MSADVLLDTNVLVYAFDADSPEKQQIAIELLERVASDGSACLSSQVIGEFFVAVTRRFPGSMTSEIAAQHTERFAEVFEVHDGGVRVVLEALRGVVRYGFSFYDAQIWAVARMNRVPRVLSEDFSAESEIEGVRFENPFS